jgi:oligoendopeptidase F
LKGQRFHDDYIALLRDTGRMTAEELTQKHLGQSLIQESFWQQSIDNIKLKIEQFELLLDQ